MALAKLERFAPLTGVVFVVLTVVGILVASSGTPDDFPAKVDQIVEYYTDESGAIMAGSWLGLLGAFFLIWFAGSVRERLRTAGQVRLGAIAFGGAVAAAAVGALVDTANLAAALRVDEYDTIDPQVATALYDLSWTIVGGALAVTIAVFVGATSLAALRSGALPSWLGVAGLVITLGLLIPFIAWAVTALALLWALLVSVLLFRGQPAAAPPAAPAPAAP